MLLFLCLYHHHHYCHLYHCCRVSVKHSVTWRWNVLNNDFYHYYYNRSAFATKKHGLTHYDGRPVTGFPLWLRGRLMKLVGAERTTHPTGYPTLKPSLPAYRPHTELRGGEEWRGVKRRRGEKFSVRSTFTVLHLGSRNLRGSFTGAWRGLSDRTQDITLGWLSSLLLPLK